MAVQCTVVGAGIIGLSTALTLEERGHEVRIVAAASGGATTSAVAGAVWFPYKAGPPVKVGAWALHTRRWLEHLAKTNPEAGVDVLTGYEITADDAWPWWADGVSELTRAPAPVAGSPIAWKFTAPRAQPSLFLPWLTPFMITVRSTAQLMPGPSTSVSSLATPSPPAAASSTASRSARGYSLATL